MGPRSPGRWTRTTCWHLTCVYLDAGRACALWLHSRAASEGEPGSTPRPLDTQALLPWWGSRPSLPRSTLSSQLKHAWGRDQPKGLPGGPHRCWRESSALPSPSRGRREEGRMAAERENWRRILNCSKMSRGLDAPPGPTPGEYQSPGWLS